MRNKHNYKESMIYYASEEEEKEAYDLGIKKCNMSYPHSLGKDDGSTDNLNAQWKLKDIRNHYDYRKIELWSDIRHRYVKPGFKNIKIKLSVQNKKAVFEKMLEISTGGFNNNSKSDEKLIYEFPLGTAYLFDSQSTKNTTYVGWNNDYPDDQDYYDDKYSCKEMTEKEFLGSAYIESEKEELTKMAEDLNISPKSDPASIRKMYECKYPTDAANDAADTMSYAQQVHEEGLENEKVLPDQKSKHYWSNLAIKQAMKKSIFQELAKQQKANEMKNETTVEVKVNGTTVYAPAAAEEVTKTDLESTSKWITRFYNEEGDLMNTTSYSPKEAKKKLQLPNKLGYTFVSYKKTASATTDIPVKDIKVS